MPILAFLGIKPPILCVFVIYWHFLTSDIVFLSSFQHCNTFFEIPVPKSIKDLKFYVILILWLKQYKVVIKVLNLLKYQWSKVI